MALIFNSLITSDLVCLFMCIFMDYSDVFFGEVAVRVFCSLKNLVIYIFSAKYLFSNNLWEFFIYYTLDRSSL